MGILGIIELILLAWGGYALVTGTLKLFKVEIEGLHARLAGLVLMLPVPLTLAVFAYQVSQLPPDATDEAKQKLLTGVGVLECCILGACLVLACVIGIVGGSSERRGAYWSDIPDSDSDVDRSSDEDEDDEDPAEKRKRIAKQDKELARRLAKKAREQAAQKGTGTEEDAELKRKQAKLRSKVAIVKVKGRGKAKRDDEDEEEDFDTTDQRRRRAFWIGGGIAAGVALLSFVLLIGIAIGARGKGSASDTEVAATTPTSQPKPTDNPPRDKDKPVDPNKDRVVDPNKDKQRPPDVPKPPPGLEGRVVPLDAPKLLPCECWAADGKSFYALEKQPGVLHHVSFPECKTLKRVELQQNANWLAMSAEGLIVTVSDAREIWLYDPDTLEVKTKIKVGIMDRAVSAPGLKLAYAADPGNPTGGVIAVVDLTTGKIVNVLNRGVNQPAFTSLQISPDGAYLFTGFGTTLYRYKLAGTKILADEASHDVTSGRGQEISLSPDGSMLCSPSGGGNNTAPGQPKIPGYSTYIFSTRSFKQPLFYIEQGAYPQAVAFDVAAQRIYANSGDYQLAVYDATKGQKLAAHKIQNGGDVWRYLVHPSGRKVVVFMSNKAVLVEVPQ